MELPTQAEQQQWKAEANEVKQAIIQKRESAIKITSINAQRLVVDELSSIFLYLVFAGLLFLMKIIEPNQVSILFVIIGFCLSLVILFVFGISAVKLRQKQNDGIVKEKQIMPLLLLSFIPYIFGLYLIIVVGIYNLFTGFTFLYLPQAIAYTYLGYLLIKKVKLIQELGIRISENK